VFCSAALGITLEFDGIGYGLDVMGVDVNEPTIPDRISPELYGGSTGVPKYEANCGFIEGGI